VGAGWGDPQAANSWIDEFVSTLVGGEPFSERIGVTPGRMTTARTPAGPIVVDDLVGDSKSFNEQASSAERSRSLYPCVEATPVPIPIDLAPLGRRAFGGKRAPPVIRLQSLLGEDVHSYPVSDARSFFGTGLYAFVRRRVQAARQGVGSAYGAPDSSAIDQDDDASGRTVPFTVHTVTNGLRTYYAPAYLIKLQTTMNCMNET